MNCTGTIAVVTDHDGGNADLTRLLDRAVEMIDDLERRWSRFLPGSELSRLNGSAGRTVRVSEQTVRLVTAMVQGWHATLGCFDPSLAGTLVELGYAASRSDAAERTSLPAGTGGRGRPDSILVDVDQRLVQLPPGTAIDPGGIGKGLAADIVFEWLYGQGVAGAAVELGGDLRCGGAAPDPDHGWAVAVDVAHDAGPDLVCLGGGGVATSTSRLRTWQVGAAKMHHLIDPTTLASSAADVVSCTVVAGTGAWAEVFTKCAFVLPVEDAVAVYEDRRVAASMTLHNGNRRCTSAWATFDRTPGGQR